VSTWTVTGAAATWGRAAWSAFAASVVALGRDLVFAGLSLAGLVPVAGLLSVVAFLTDFANWLADRSGGPSTSRLGVLPVLLVFAALPTARWLAVTTRKLAGRWCGVTIGVPYRPVPRRADASLRAQLWLRARWLLTDPATWRDLLWVVVNTCGGCLLVLAPVVLVLYGLASATLSPWARNWIAAHGHVALMFIHGAFVLPAVVAYIIVIRFSAPMLLAAYGLLARSILGPTKGSELARRVSHLAQTRSEALDSSAIELRRIERDLHDGAQARLVAMGMTLEVADQLIDSDPVAAHALLAEARDSSTRALAELRNLVRGIHPPVLADRGLVEAIRALALDSPVPVRVAAELPGRPPPPVESAAYFAVSELLANVSKHAEAGRVWIDVRQEAGALRIGVTDDGVGGADVSRGSGLRGIERRLAAFDGVLAVSSPPGGPTVVNLEIPCG
jgi:signal transduction histidine kinase